jgi:hypothetical protein
MNDLRATAPKEPTFAASHRDLPLVMYQRIIRSMLRIQHGVHTGEVNAAGDRSWPKVGVWDPDRDARTRVKDSLIARLIYDPDDISRQRQMPASLSTHAHGIENVFRG